jgi:hypothetical protein
MPQAYPTNKNKHITKNSNNNEITKETKTTIIPSLNKGKTLTIIACRWG